MEEDKNLEKSSSSSSASTVDKDGNEGKSSFDVDSIDFLEDARESDTSEDEDSLKEVVTIPSNILREAKERVEWEANEIAEDGTDKMDVEKAEGMAEGYSDEEDRDKTTSSNSSEISFEIRTIPSNFSDEATQKWATIRKRLLHGTPDSYIEKNLTTSSDDEEDGKMENKQEFETIEESNENCENLEDRLSVITFPSEEEINEMEEIPLNEIDGPRKMSFAALVRFVVAVRRMRERYSKNSFASAIQPLHVTFLLGYYCFVVPFKMVLDKEDGKFKMHFNYLQMIVSIYMLLVATCFRLSDTYDTLTLANLKAPFYILVFSENTLTCFMLLAFLFIVFFMRKEICAVFEIFHLQTASSIRKYESKKWKVFFRILVPMLFFLGISHWNVWVNFVILGGINMDTLSQAYKEGRNFFSLPHYESKLYFAVVLISTTFGKLYGVFIMYFMEFLMWAASITLFNIVWQANKLFLRKSSFNLKQDTDIFKVIVDLVQKVSGMMGPMTTMFGLQVIPYTIMITYWMTLGSYLESWREYVFLPLKLGHVFIACSASSMAAKLMKHIFDKLIDRNPVEIFQIPDRELRMLRMMELDRRIEELTSLTSEPISLTGLEFFVINYQFLGGVILAVLTNGLLFVQWVRDTGAVPTQPPPPDIIYVCLNGTEELNKSIYQ